MNSAVSQNRNGVLVLDGGSARIGVDNRNAPGGNTISMNGSSGIVVSNGSAASIAMNQITGNGADPAAPGGGVLVISSAAVIAGGNTDAVGVASSETRRWTFQAQYGGNLRAEGGSCRVAAVNVIG